MNQSAVTGVAAGRHARFQRVSSMMEQLNTAEIPALPGDQVERPSVLAGIRTPSRVVRFAFAAAIAGAPAGKRAGDQADSPGFVARTHAAKFHQQQSDGPYSLENLTGRRDELRSQIQLQMAAFRRAPSGKSVSRRQAFGVISNMRSQLELIEKAIARHHSNALRTAVSNAASGF